MAFWGCLLFHVLSRWELASCESSWLCGFSRILFPISCESSMWLFYIVGHYRISSYSFSISFGALLPLGIFCLAAVWPPSNSGLSGHSALFCCCCRILSLQKRNYRPMSPSSRIIFIATPKLAPNPTSATQDTHQEIASRRQNIEAFHFL